MMRPGSAASQLRKNSANSSPKLGGVPSPNEVRREAGWFPLRNVTLYGLWNHPRPLAIARGHPS